MTAQADIRFTTRREDPNADGWHEVSLIDVDGKYPGRNRGVLRTPEPEVADAFIAMVDGWPGVCDALDYLIEFVNAAFKADQMSIGFLAKQSPNPMVKARAALALARPPVASTMPEGDENLCQGCGQAFDGADYCAVCRDRGYREGRAMRDTDAEGGG